MQPRLGGTQVSHEIDEVDWILSLQGEEPLVVAEGKACHRIGLNLGVFASLAAMIGKHSATLGQRVQVISATGSFTGTAKAVTDSGSLIVTDDDGQDREVLAADVSVRGLMGYA